MPSQNLFLGSGFVKLDSKEETKRYFKSLVDYYQRESDDIANRLGDLLRTKPGQGQERPAQKEERQDGKKDVKVMSSGWSKMGTIMVNASDSGNAKTELLFQLLKEYKLKLGWSTDALKAFEDQTSMSLPESGEYSVFVKNGVPERIIVSAEARKIVVFAYAARFRVT